MTVVINIWKGELPQRTGYNAIFGLNVGHASMLIINDKNPKDKIYISHRPQTINPQNNFGKDTDKKYFFRKNFTPKAETISFDEDCDRRKRQPDNQIIISGLNESKIKYFHERYISNNLTESESQYHSRKNNCCSVVVYFIRKGLKCPDNKICKFCFAERNQPDWKIQGFCAFLQLSCIVFWLLIYIYSYSLVLKTILFLIILVIAFLTYPFSVFNLEACLLNFSYKKINSGLHELSKILRKK